MKIASRYLLPMEILVAMFLISWGLSGWLGGGVLWKTLKADGLNEEWAALFCGLGAAQLGLALFEGGWGRRWPQARLLCAVTVRYWLAFLAGVLWVWAVYLSFVLPYTVISLAVQAPVCWGACVWIFFGNRKVACILDPAVPTQRLQRELLGEHEHVRGH